MQLSWGTPFYLLALYGLVRYFSAPKKDKKTVGWTPFESVGVTFFIYFISQFLAALIVYIFPLASGKSSQQATAWLTDSTVGQFAFTLFVEAIVIGMVIFFLKRRTKTLATIGLNRSPKWSDAGYAALGLLAYFVGYIVVLNAVKAAIPALNVDQEQQIGFEAAKHGGELVLVFLSLVVLPPLAEEILVRGFLYTGLKKLPKAWAIILTSALFAMAHLQAGSGAQLLWVAAIDTFVLSVMLIYLRDKTGSLWASIMLHALKNGIAFASIFIFKLV